MQRLNAGRAWKGLPALIATVLLFASFASAHEQHGTPQTASPEDARAKLAVIAIRDAKDLPDYIRRAKQIERLMPELEAFYQQFPATMTRLKRKYQSRPDLMKLASFIERLNERDQFGLLLLKEEVRQAAHLALLPPEKQQEFFDSRIAPLMQVEDSVVSEEIEMATEGMNQGLPLPKDILDALRARQHQQARRP